MSLYIENKDIKSKKCLDPEIDIFLIIIKLT